MVQDEIVPVDKLGPAYLDRGVFFGDGVYEVLRSYDSRIFALEDHLERFTNSLAKIRITGVDIEEVRRRVSKAFSASDIASAKIYFHVTRGSEPRTHIPGETLQPNFFLTVTELHDDPKLKTEGVAVSTHPDWRWKRCDIKSLNLLPNILARMDAGEKGCEEAILVDDAGLIIEGAGSAFFAVLNGRLQTAPLTANILPSITRKYVIKAAQSIGLPVVEESLTLKQAETADELFLAVTTKDIVPVVKFDDKTIGDGKPGRYTRLLIKQFLSHT
jgi:D-alanine transaminase